MLRTLVARCCLLAMIVFALPAAMPAPVRAQEPAPALTISQIDGSAYPDITAIVTVLDARGVPVAGLTAAQFQASDGETQLTVTGAAAGQDASLGLSVIIVIDVSGSMAGDALTRAKQAATEFAAQLGPNDQAALVAFNQQVTPIVGMTSDRQALTAGIAGLQADGGTALYEAAQTSAYLASAVQSPRRAVVLLTDGVNDAPGSLATADGSLTVARDAGVPIFTVGFGDAPDAGFLQALSGATQGQYRPATAETVSSVYAELATLLRSQYVLTIRAPGAADGEDATLRLIADVAGTPAAGEAPYKRGDAPAAAPTQIAPPAVTGSGTSRAPAFVVGGLVVAAIAALAAFGLSRWYRRRRLRRAQLAVVAPNPRTAAAQGLPAAAAGSIVADIDHGAGRLIALDGAVPQSYEFTSTPLRIGSGSECEVRLAASPEVASRHAVIWMKDGKIMLRHPAGPRRPTLVAGRPIEWIILDPGDEFTVGGQRFQLEAR